MLDKLKKYTSGWIVQILLLLLVISFAVWGVADIFTGFGANDIAKIGNITISGTEFRRRYDMAMQALTTQFGRQFTPQEAQQIGIPSQVLSRLLAEATLDDTVHDMGLSLSPNTVSRLIREDQSLYGPTGKFDRTVFDQIARQQGQTSDQLVLDRRAEYIRSQLAQALVGEVNAPATLMKAVAEYRDDGRVLSYVVLTAPPATDIAEPTDADLSAYFDAHKSDWKAPEYRAIEYFEVTPDTVAKPSDVSDEDAQKRYDAQKTRFETPATRHVEQIVFKDKADADAAAKALADGTTFDQLVAQRQLKPSDIDLGEVTKDKIVDPAIADAAFGLADGGVSGVIDGKFGPVIVRVSNIKPEVVKSFDEVKDQLKLEIAAEQAVAEIGDLHDSIEDARAGGAKISEVAGKYGMKLVTIPAVDAEGKDPNGNPVPDLPANLLTAAFQTDVGLENDPVQPVRNAYVWYDVTAVTPAHDRTLADVRDKVVVAWKDDQRQKKVAAQADDIKAKVAGGEDIAKVAADDGLTVNKSESLTRSSKPTADLSADAIKAAFDGPKGYIAVANGVEPMTKIVLVVDASTVPDFKADAPELTQIKAQLSSQLVNDLLAAYVTERQAKINMQINQAAIATALGLTTEN